MWSLVGLCLVALCVPGWAVLSPTETFPHSIEILPNEEYHLYWKYDDETITFEIHVKSLGWVGFGISPNGGMTDADIVIGWVTNGQVTFDDRHATSNARPVVDASQDWTLLQGSETATHTVLKFSRKRIACDSQDLEITDGTVRVIWAYGSADPSDGTPSYHSSNRGTKSIQMVNPTVEMTLPNNAQTIDFLNPNVTIPNTDPTYWCQIFAMPNLGSKHHVIKPIVFPSHVGYPLGTSGTPIYVRMETHYDNPSLTSGLVDSSGLRLTYTSTLRSYDLGIIEAGMMVHKWHIIPPKFPNLASYGYCTKECLEQSMGTENQLNVFAAMVHSHLIGRAVRVHHVRGTEELPYLTTDDYYDFNFQETRMLQSEVAIKKGDFLIVQCNYTSTGRSAYTKGGLSSNEEMCLVYLYYYPAINMTNCESLPLPSQTLKFANAETTFSNGEFYVSSGPHAGKDLAQVVVDTDWSSETTRQAYQQAIIGGSVTARCQANAAQYPVHYQTVTVPNITVVYTPGEPCGTSIATRHSLPLAAFIVTFIGLLV